MLYLHTIQASLPSKPDLLTLALDLYSSGCNIFLPTGKKITNKSQLLGAKNLYGSWLIDSDETGENLIAESLVSTFGSRTVAQIKAADSCKVCGNPTTSTRLADGRICSFCSSCRTADWPSSVQNNIENQSSTPKKSRITLSCDGPVCRLVSL